MATLLRLDGVSKNFGALQVAKDIRLEVAESEALGIIGSNGAGKSTLFNLITGTLPVSAGRVWFEGRDLTLQPPSVRCRAGIARSFQIPHPFGGMTVYENLLVAAAFGDASRSVGKHQHCADLLERTGLRPKANVPAGRLSLLERKRLELARALATRPRLLLLDEIAGGLTQAECIDLVESIKSIRASGVSIIWIEHVVHALTAVVERLIVLHGGGFIADGPPAAVMREPKVREIYMGISGDERAAA